MVRAIRPGGRAVVPNACVRRAEGKADLYACRSLPAAGVCEVARPLGVWRRTRRMTARGRSRVLMFMPARARGGLAVPGAGTCPGPSRTKRSTASVPSASRSSAACITAAGRRLIPACQLRSHSADVPYRLRVDALVDDAPCAGRCPHENAAEQPPRLSVPVEGKLSASYIRFSIPPACSFFSSRCAPAPMRRRRFADARAGRVRA